MTLNLIATKSIPNGTKFVALYNDGSGAAIYRVDSHGRLYNSHGDNLGYSPDVTLMDNGHAYWIELPKTFKLWCETK